MKPVTNEELNKLPHKYQVMFAVFCVEQVTKYLDDKTRELALKAIAVTKLWLEGKASVEDCMKAADAAYAAAYAADVAYAAYAAYAAAYVAYAAYAADAADAAYAADAEDASKEIIVKEQWDYYYELLNFYSNFEKIVLKTDPIVN